MSTGSCIPGPPPNRDVLSILSEARCLMPLRKRGANSQLYSALILAMEAAELCCANPAQMERLATAITELPRDGKNRSYVERGSSVYQLVCRYVFFGDENPANINRYAIALREAAARGVTSETLADRLDNGGVNQFYLARPLDVKTIATKCIRLAEQITHHKSEPFTLTLKRNEDNSYTVLEFTSGGNRGEHA